MAFKLDPSLVTAAALAACVAGWMATGTVVVSGTEDTGRAPPPPAERAARNDAPFAVRVATARPVERARTLEMRGRTEADARVSVRAETMGRVAERPVERGEEVAEGDILCRLDPGVRKAALAEAEADAARARLEHEAATRLEGKGFESAMRVATTQAELDAANARVAAARLELERTVIRAPVAGIVEAPIAEVGDHLAVGATCATILDIDPIMMTGAVSERAIAGIEPGREVTVDLVTGERVSGKVDFVSRAADPETRTFEVEIAIDNRDGAIREGVTATARIARPPVTAHRLEPSSLVLADGGELGVRIVDEADTVRFVPVRLVGQDRDGVWVAGIDGVARVITVGQDYVVEGQTVRPVPGPAREHS